MEEKPVAFSENRGPRVGLNLTKEQATILLQKHNLGENCASLEYIDRGYNNRTFLANSHFIIRLGGRFWTRIKTENEVATIIFLSRRFPSLKVPKILGFCSNRELSSVGHEYIVMEKLPGVPLDELMPELTLPQRKRIVDEVVLKILRPLKSIKFDNIGSLQFTPEIGETFGMSLDLEGISEYDVQVGSGLEARGGPFQTYLDYLRSTLNTKLDELRKCKFVLETNGDLVERIEKFISIVTDPELTPFPEEVIGTKFGFIHGDFELRNILVDKDRLEVTGLLDFEFSGSFPLDEDWFCGFEGFGGANVGEEEVFQEEEGKIEDPLKEYFLKQCLLNDIPVPENIPGHQTRALMYFFKENICPWWMTEEGQEIPEKWYKERDDARRRVIKVLEMYGC